MSAEGGALIVGGGPTGLAAAVELGRLGAGPVTVIERERRAGGIPRHSDHPGFGIRDLRRVMSGPAYAERYRHLASEAGAEVLSETMVTGFGERGSLWLTGPAGRREVSPAAVLLATGCRERPRSARLVPGVRGPGVMTTSSLQQLVHLHGRRDIGRRAVVAGAEHVSFSAIATLAQGGASTVALVTEHARQQSLGVFRLGARVRYGAPVWTRTRVSSIYGAGGVVEGVELTDLASGVARRVACDLVIFSADWIPDHELAVMAGCELDPGSKGPVVDPAARTTAPGFFAAGNLVHPAETADSCALSGRHAARAIAHHLARDPGYDVSGAWQGGVRVIAAKPLTWVVPNIVPAAAQGARPARDRFLLRSSTFLTAPALEAVQDGNELWRGRISRLIPGRSAHFPADWISRVDPAGGPVAVRLRRR